ncbi:MAG: hypothetical protein C4325_13605 [Blastocatellia bacterium]
MTETRIKRAKPDIRAITRLVPPEGNLVQGQSELPIDPALAAEAAYVIAANNNHYGPSEGDSALRNAVAEKIARFNGVKVDPAQRQLMITSGGTGALIGIAQAFLTGHSALVFEPYYPYHRRILEEFGSRAETFELNEELAFDGKRFFERCRELKLRKDFPLAAIIVCTPANPTGKVMTESELQIIADAAQEFDLLVISDEVYEHYVTAEQQHVSIAVLPDMFERTITVNSFSKSWNISGWRLGYTFGPERHIARINSIANVVYVCPATPLQSALASVLMKDPGYYHRLEESFNGKREFVASQLRQLDFELFESGSAFYIWARIPRQFSDAVAFNEMLMRDAGVGLTPGSAFADSERWDAYVRICIAREDRILHSAIEKIRSVLNR